MPEIISLQVGQCGNQMGAAFWPRLCLEHHIDPTTGHLELPDSPEPLVDRRDVFFHESEAGQFVPRAVLVDLESGPVDSLMGSAYGRLFNPNNSVTVNVGGAANVWAKGHYSHGCDMLPTVLDAVRRELELTDCLQGFQLCHSLGGGTGSGLGTRLALSLTEEFSDKNIFTFSVAPSSQASNVICESYNCILALNQLCEYATATFILENSAIEKILLNVLKRRQLYGWKEVNKTIAEVMCGVTTSLRFPGQLNADLRKLAMNLVPFPQLHFLLSKIAPLTPDSSLGYDCDSIEALIKELFSPKNLMVDCNPRRGRYLGAASIVRGKNVSCLYVDHFFSRYRQEHSEDFVNWIPDGVKVAVCPAAPLNGNLTSTFIANNTAIREVFLRQLEQFGKLLHRNAYIQHYVDEGMELSEFDEAKQNVESLTHDYQTCQEVTSDDVIDLRTRTR